MEWHQDKKQTQNCWVHAQSQPRNQVHRLCMHRVSVWTSSPCMRSLLVRRHHLVVRISTVMQCSSMAGPPAPLPCPESVGLVGPPADMQCPEPSGLPVPLRHPEATGSGEPPAAAEPAEPACSSLVTGTGGLVHTYRIWGWWPCPPPLLLSSQSRLIHLCI